MSFVVATVGGTKMLTELSLTPYTMPHCEQGECRNYALMMIHKSRANGGSAFYCVEHLGLYILENIGEAQGITVLDC